MRGGLTTAAGWSSRVLVLATTAALPWALAGMPAWPRLAAAAALLAAVLCWLVSVSLEAVRMPGTVLHALVALGVGLVAVTVVPFPAALVQRLSPEVVRLHTALGGDDGSVAFLPLSLDPATTADDLCLLLLAGVCLGLGTALFRSRTHLAALLITVVAVGLAVVALGLLQMLGPYTRQVGLFTLSEDGGAPFGPFVNRNNAAGWLTLAAGAGISLLGMGGKDERQWAYRGATGSLTDLRLVTAVVVALLLGGIVTTLSRGGMVAAAVGLTAAVAAAVAHTRRLLAVGGGLSALALSIGLAFWVGRMDMVGQRFDQAAGELERGANVRTTVWADGLSAVGSFPLFGSGLGGFPYLQRLRQGEYMDATAFRAENQYVEALTTGGVPAFLLLLAAAGTATWTAWRLTALEVEHEAGVLGPGFLFLVVAQAVHALTDFGLHVPANACLFALLVGAMLGRYGELRRRSRHRAGRKDGAAVVQTPFGIGYAFVGAMAAGLLVSVPWQVGAVAKQQLTLDAYKLRDIADGSEQPDLQTLADTAAATEAALRLRPGDADLLWRAAETRLALYRVETLERLQARYPHTSRDVLYDWTGLDRLHAGGVQAPASAGQLWQRRAAQRHLVAALAYLHDSRATTPLLPWVHLRLAQLGPVDPRQEGDVASLEHLATLAPADARMLFVAGRMHWTAGRRDAAVAVWRRVAALTDRFDTNILERAATPEDFDRLLAEVMPEDAGRLGHLVDGPYRGPKWLLFRERLQRRIVALAPADPSDAADDGLLAAVAGALAETGAKDRAVAWYLELLKQDPQRHPQRYELAVLLAEAGRTEEALEQARRLRATPLGESAALAKLFARLHGADADADADAVPGAAVTEPVTLEGRTTSGATASPTARSGDPKG